MKRFLLLSVAILVVAGTLFATGTPEKTVTGSKAAEKYLKVGSDQNPTTMDPALYQDLASSQCMRNVYETLVAYDAKVKDIHPLLADSWSTPDLKVWTFKLHKGVHFQPGKFQNGREMTAADVKYSFDREIKISPFVRLYMIDKTEVVDRYTVRITLKYPYAPFLTVLTDIGASIVPKEEAEGWGDNFTLHPVGTGPFKMTDWVKDDHMDFVRNDNYWGERPHLDRVTYKFIPNKSVLTVALLGGDVDITSDILDQDLPQVQNSKDVSAQIVGGVNTYAIYMNSVNGPTTNPKFREMFFRAVNVQQIAKVLFPNGTGVAAYGPIPPGSWAYNPNIKQYYTPYDPAKAKEIVQQAGLAGTEITIYTPEDPNRQRAAVVVQNMLKDVGIDAKVTSLEWGSFTDVASKAKADAYTIGWTWYPDPEFFMYYMFQSSRKGTYGNGGDYNNPKVDALIAKGEAARDRDQRIKYYREAESLVMQDRYYFPMYHKQVVNGVNKRVIGYTASPDMTIRLYAPGTNVDIAQ